MVELTWHVIPCCALQSRQKALRIRAKAVAKVAA